MNTTHVERDPLAALRAELTMAAGRRIRRRRARRRTALIVAAIALLIGATAATAALIKSSTGVPAVDKLLEIEVPPSRRPGPGPASKPLRVPEGDHNTNVVAYLARDGSVCIASADFKRGGSVRGGFGGCPPLESVSRQVASRGAVWYGFTLGLDARAFKGLVAGEVEAVRPLVPGDWRVLMSPPWTPRANNPRSFRLVVLIDDRDYGNPDDGFQMEEMNAIPREASMPPAVKLTYRDGHTRLARGR